MGKKKTSPEDYEVNRNIAAIMKSKNLSVREVASRMNVPYDRVYKTVNCKRTVFAQELVGFSLALGVSVREIFGI
jgi:predicted transcriptional regulator